MNCPKCRSNGYSRKTKTPKWRCRKCGHVWGDINRYPIVAPAMSESRMQSWKKLQEELKSPRWASYTLSGANLAGREFSGANFRSANLSGTNLTGANLAPPILWDGTYYHGLRTNLSGADLTGANLTLANLTQINAAGADLTNANLTQADLTDAKLTGANLTGANLTNADLLDSALNGAIGADLSAAKNAPEPSAPEPPLGYRWVTDKEDRNFKLVSIFWGALFGLLVGALTGALIGAVINASFGWTLSISAMILAIVGAFGSLRVYTSTPRQARLIIGQKGPLPS